MSFDRRLGDLLKVQEIAETRFSALLDEALRRRETGDRPRSDFAKIMMELAHAGAMETVASIADAALTGNKPDSLKTAACIAPTWRSLAAANIGRASLAPPLIEQSFAAYEELRAAKKKDLGFAVFMGCPALFPGVAALHTALAFGDAESAAAIRAALVKGGVDFSGASADSMGLVSAGQGIPSLRFEPETLRAYAALVGEDPNPNAVLDAREARLAILHFTSITRPDQEILDAVAAVLDDPRRERVVQSRANALARRGREATLRALIELDPIIAAQQDAYFETLAEAAARRSGPIRQARDPRAWWPPSEWAYRGDFAGAVEAALAKDADRPEGRRALVGHAKDVREQLLTIWLLAAAAQR